MAMLLQVSEVVRTVMKTAESEFEDIGLLSLKDHSVPRKN